MIGPLEDRQDEVTARVAESLHIATTDVWLTTAVAGAINYALIKTNRVELGFPDDEVHVIGWVGFAERMYMDRFSPNGVQVSVADPGFEPIFQPEDPWKHYRHFFQVRQVRFGVG